MSNSRRRRSDSREHSRSRSRDRYDGEDRRTRRRETDRDDGSRSSSPRGRTTEQDRQMRRTHRDNTANNLLNTGGMHSGGEGIPWAMVPSMMAAMASTLQQGSGRRDTVDSRQEEEIDELRADVRRLRRERNEEEKRTKSAREEVKRFSMEVDVQRKRAKYMSYKIEYLRRELIARKRDRSPTGEKDELRHLPQSSLIDTLSTFEEIRSSNNRATGLVGQSTASNGKSLGERMGMGDETRKLVTRIGASTHVQTTGRNIIRPLSINTDFKINADVVRGALVPLFDSNNNRIIPSAPIPGLRILYGIVIDLSKPLPTVPPTPSDINPLTGYNWTRQELLEYPYGVPGWSSNISEVMPPNKAPVRHVNQERMRAMDQSLLMVALPRITETLDGPPWRYPVTHAEADQLLGVTMVPCNLLALEFWRKYTNDCSSVPKAMRTELQTYVTAQSSPRPSWAPFRRRVESTEQHDRKIARRREKTGMADRSGDNNVGTASGVTLQFGSAPPIATQDATGTPVITRTETSPVEHEEVPRPEGLYAGSDHLNTWVRYLNANPMIDIPGVPRNADGNISNVLALRGLLRVAKIGCEDSSGAQTIYFIHEVVKYIIETPYHFRPSQLLQGVIIADENDMTVEKIRDHLDFVSSDACQFTVDVEKDGEDFNGVTEWLSIVDPVPGGGDDETKDDDTMMGECPDLMM